MAVFKVLVLSKWNVKLPKLDAENLIIIGNGPTLKKDLATAQSLGKSDYMAVNYSINSDMFYDIKPTHFLLCDKLFFMLEHKEKHKELYEKLNSKITWEMNLFIPQDQKIKFYVLLDLFQLTLPKITVYFYNKTNTNGTSSLIHWMYLKNLAMPNPTTVLIPGLMLGINMGYKEINLTGASHNYHENIVVNHDNVLMLKVQHFYKEDFELKPYYKYNSTDTWTLSEFYMTLHKMFAAYKYVSIFAKKSGVQLYNCTKESYIDHIEKR